MVGLEGALCVNTWTLSTSGAWMIILLIATLTSIAFTAFFLLGGLLCLLAVF